MAFLEIHKNAKCKDIDNNVICMRLIYNLKVESVPLHDFVQRDGSNAIWVVSLFRNVSAYQHI